MDKLRLVYEQTGRAVWMSHLDTMRTLQRAIKRAAIPIRYSEGFNPHELISILLPLSVPFSYVCILSGVVARVRACKRKHNVVLRLRYPFI